MAVAVAVAAWQLATLLVHLVTIAPHLSPLCPFCPPQVTELAAEAKYDLVVIESTGE